MKQSQNVGLILAQQSWKTNFDYLFRAPIFMNLLSNVYGVRRKKNKENLC